MSCNCSTSHSHVTIAKYNFIADTFGPFHDETILAGVDRMLYIFGFPIGIPSLSRIGSSFRRHVGMKGIEEIVRKLPVKSLDKIGKFVQDAFNDNSINNNQAEKEASCAEEITKPNCKPTEKANNHHVCPNCGRRKAWNITARTSSILKKCNIPSSPAPSCRLPKKSALTRSFSLCSLACRNIKDKLSNFQKTVSPQWHWTRKYSESQHQVYEIFPNDPQNAHSKYSKENYCPNMILIVAPTGKVYPFEMVSTHF